ncbi:MAG: hypothetical protein QOF58_1455 [Pseudonocardiales bacterium]|nr:hypothetical protein [Pseudonocardiales bacterium]
MATRTEVDLARTRARHTGEPYQTALQEIRRHGQQHGPLPRAEGIVALVDFLLLSHLGRGRLAASTRWPDNTVLGIRSVTPRPHTTLVDIDPAVLGPMLETVLPRAIHDAHTQVFTAGLAPAPLHSGSPNSFSDEYTVPPTFRSVRGAAGVRAVLGRHGLELRCFQTEWQQHHGDDALSGGAADAVVLRGVDEQAWARAREEILAGYAANEVPLWRDFPASWPMEESLGEQDRLHDCRTSIIHGSALLRRIGLLREKGVRCLEPDFGFGLGGHLFGNRTWPARRPDAMAVRVEPPTRPEDPGQLVWIDAAPVPGDQRHWVIKWRGRMPGTDAAPDRAQLPPPGTPGTEGPPSPSAGTAGKSRVDAVLTSSWADGPGTDDEQRVLVWTATWTCRETGATGTATSRDVDDLLDHQVVEAVRPTDSSTVHLEWHVVGSPADHDFSTEELLQEHGGSAVLPSVVWREWTCLCGRCVTKRHPELRR